jgi:hypothetical protein
MAHTLNKLQKIAWWIMPCFMLFFKLDIQMVLMLVVIKIMPVHLTSGLNIMIKVVSSQNHYNVVSWLFLFCLHYLQIYDLK